MKLYMIFALSIMLEVKTYCQQIAIDQGFRAGSIWCFPLVNDSLSYYFLPSVAKLATNEQGLPKFSLIRYVTTKPNNSENSISDADGGAILHFLVEYETPQKSIKKAENIIQEKISKNAVLKGPLLFKKARYALVSSILNDNKYKILSTGDAPILEGSAMAFSFELKPKDSKILLESFKTGTSDVSIVFDFTFEGFSNTYEAKLEVNWSKTHEMTEKKMGLKFYTIGLEAKENIEYLIKNEAIKLTTIGSDTKMEGLVDRAYSKILELLYEPVAPEKIEENDKSGSNLFGDLFNDLKKEIESIIPFSFNASYKRKNIKKEGNAVFDFNSRATIEKHHFVAFNIGDIHTKYGGNKLIFNDIPLYDIAFQQRQITVGLDGELERNFKNMLNNVTVIIRKTHQDSTVTIKEIFLNKESFKNQNTVSATYLSHNDIDRLEWLVYDYQVIWNLKGGGKITSNWITDSSPLINLYLPYSQRKINFEGNLKTFSDQNISKIIVELKYKLAGQFKSETMKISPNENLELKILEITIPNELENIDYIITWIGKDGTIKTRKGIDKYGLIVIDQ